jgi:DNA-directed RNA polymerase specialized sigma24 family protein
MGSTIRHATIGAHQARAATGPGNDRAALLAGLHAGDRSAFTQLYRDTLPAMTAHVAARLDHGDDDVVADLVHDAFADALADPTLIGADVLASLRLLCDRAFTRHVRSQRRYLRAARTVYEDHQRAGRSTPQPATVRSRGFEAVAVLPDGERQVAQLRFLDGHTPRVTARLLGRSVATVVDLERRARQRLRQDLTNPVAAAAHPATAAGRA